MGSQLPPMNRQRLARKGKAFLISFIALFLWANASAAGDGAKETFLDAQRLAEDHQTDFAFLEYLSILKKYPEDPLVPEAAFGAAEYYFLQKNFEGAKKLFEQWRHPSLETSSDIVRLAYLYQCASKLGRLKEAREIESSLKEALSSKRFLDIFQKKHVEIWTSPLGGRFELRESVDKLEIILNDESFYTATLP